MFNITICLFNNIKKVKERGKEGEEEEEEEEQYQFLLAATSEACSARKVESWLYWRNIF